MHRRLVGVPADGISVLAQVEVEIRTRSLGAGHCRNPRPSTDSVADDGLHAFTQLVRVGSPLWSRSWLRSPGSPMVKETMPW
jgi:hypothetical protein